MINTVIYTWPSCKLPVSFKVTMLRILDSWAEMLWQSLSMEVRPVSSQHTSLASTLISKFSKLSSECILMAFKLMLKVVTWLTMLLLPKRVMLWSSWFREIKWLTILIMIRLLRWCLHANAVELRMLVLFFKSKKSNLAYSIHLTKITRVIFHSISTWIILALTKTLHFTTQLKKATLAS